MSRPTKEQIESAFDRWKGFIHSNEFTTILSIIETQRGVYDIATPESQIPHIQSERNGGIKGWDLFKKILISGCDNVKLFESVTEEAPEQSLIENYTDYA